MNQYDSYKDSDLLCVDMVPKSWTTTMNKHHLIEKKVIVGEDWKDYKLLSLTKEGIIYRDVESGKGKFPESFDTYKSVESGDIIICLYDIEETPRTVGLSDLVGMISGSYHIYEPHKMVGRFFYYWFLSIDNGKGLKPYYTGLRNVVRPPTFLSLPLYLPPLNEQHQIVTYLDNKTTSIDSLIQSKEKKIELLKEKRTSLINQVVTKGLNPDVEMKDSGVEWIGKIPSGWKSPKLRFYTTKIGSGSTPRGGSEIYEEEGVPFIRSQNVHFSGLSLENVSFITDEIHLSMSGSKVKRDDVLLNITGGSIGRCCLVDVDFEMNVNQHVSIIRTKDSLSPKFLNYLLYSDIGQKQVEYNVSGGNREGLTIDGISNFFIPFPPLNEQQEIVSYLDKETKLIDETISSEQKKIELLKEYKQSLISEVVTGKRKVTTDD